MSEPAAGNSIVTRRVSEGIQILEPRNDYSTVKHCTSLAGAAGLYGMRNWYVAPESGHFADELANIISSLLVRSRRAFSSTKLFGGFFGGGFDFYEGV